MCLNCLELRKLFAKHQMDFYEEKYDERHNRSHPEFPGQLEHFIFELIINLLLFCSFAEHCETLLVGREEIGSKEVVLSSRNHN